MNNVNSLAMLGKKPAEPPLSAEETAEECFFGIVVKGLSSDKSHAVAE